MFCAKQVTKRNKRLSLILNLYKLDIDNWCGQWKEFKEEFGMETNISVSIITEANGRKVVAWKQNKSLKFIEVF